MFDDAVSVFPDNERKMLASLPDEIKRKTNEIRYREKKPLMLYGVFGCIAMNKNGTVSDEAGICSYIPDSGSIERLLCRLTSFSVYSRRKEIAEGFITYGMGHRAGLCGTAVTSDGKIENVRSIDAVNIRIAGLHRGVSDAFFRDHLMPSDGSFIVAGAPCSGKTTFLRDLAENISRSKVMHFPRVTVIDERFEFGGMTETGTLGLCDILRGYPKEKGTVHALRTLSPDFIICDEIADHGDAAAVITALNSGVRFCLSIHAGSFEELKRKAVFSELVSAGNFSAAVILTAMPYPCTVSEIADLKGNCI